MRQEDDAEIKAAVERAGFFTTFTRYGHGGDVQWNIVLVSCRTERGFEGRSFKLFVEQGQWRLITWRPADYLIPSDADLAGLCVGWLDRSGTDMALVPPDIVERYRLVEVPMP